MKTEASKVGDSALFKLGWAVKGKQELIQLGRKLIVEIRVLQG